jgi:hypothetical protein
MAMAEYQSALKPVPIEKAFYFFSSIGNYTGKSAASLKEFFQSIKEVDEKSLGFHLQRGDFENWISGVLSDEELARQVKELRRENLAAQDLRNRLHEIVSKRLEQLTRQSTVARSAADLLARSSQDKNRE